MIRAIPRTRRVPPLSVLGTFGVFSASGANVESLSYVKSAKG
jgi:hypothetical protein